ncbi:beta strand repeat-containing protein [Actinokineospora iranica]|uniref:Small secreted domain n=1 Tax=Actinokineospora iranica TaxID=1271860 RepID=A0A1G6PLN9_9PSEU|nr:hypothetical protein [Actinokineospora iranica]SDC81093.1 hypothetical protein SAMN05216174_104367 [Actinokineospora iranica]
MQTWAKRGLQSALVTGGLLMLGTGIASADEDVNPDRPASALDGSVTVPVKIDNNALGTPAGQRDLPELHHEAEVGRGALAEAVPRERVPAVVAEALSRAAARVSEQDTTRGNRANGDVVLPVDMSGNAVAAGGDAAVSNTSRQSAGHSKPVTSVSPHRTLSNNAVDLDYTSPVQITGNTVAAGADAESVNHAAQHATSDGDVTVDGRRGVLAGNALAGHGTTPAQFNGNALAGAGNATSHSTTASESTSGGVVTTSGQDSTLSGNAGAAPVAVPFRANGHAVSLAGNADAIGANATTPRAGAQRPDFNGNPTYLHTAGEDATLSGNIVQPALAGPAAGDCAAATGVGTADALCASAATATAGGGNRTNGANSVLSGGAGHAPVALPTQAGGAAGGVAGTANATRATTADTAAGGHTRTRGHDGVLSGTVLSAPAAGPTDMCANGTGVVGQAEVACDTIVRTTAGGDTGTTGHDSIIGGNGVIAPVALPVDGTTNGGAALGDSGFTATEYKETIAGGDNSTADDNAVLAANLVQAPFAGPAQVFGNGGGAVANTAADAAAVNRVVAGGNSTASGTGGTLSGNIAQAPATAPVQGFGAGASALGHGTENATGTTQATAGGAAVTDGAGGRGTGNVVTAPVAAAGQLFGDSAAVFGENRATATNDIDTVAGGDTTTSGQSGELAGNVVSPQALPIAQASGLGASGVAGHNTATGANDTFALAGGDIVTDGKWGYLAGNLFDVPTATVVQPHGDAVGAVASQSTGNSATVIDGASGGMSVTDGDHGQLSGLSHSIPVGTDAPLYNVPNEVIAEAMTNASHDSDITVGEDEPQFKLPPTGALPATALPKVPNPAELRGLFGRQEQVAVRSVDDPLTAVVKGMTGERGLAEGLANGLSTSLGSTLPVGQLPVSGLGGEAAARDLPVGPVSDSSAEDLTSRVPVGSVTDAISGVRGLVRGSAPRAARDLPVESVTDDLATDMRSAANGASVRGVVRAVPGGDRAVQSRNTRVAGVPVEKVTDENVADGVRRHEIGGGNPVGSMFDPAGVAQVVGQVRQSVRHLPVGQVTDDLLRQDLAAGAPGSLPLGSVVGGDDVQALANRVVTANEVTDILPTVPVERQEPAGPVLATGEGTDVLPGLPLSAPGPAGPVSAGQTSDLLPIKSVGRGIRASLPSRNLSLRDVPTTAIYNAIVDGLPVRGLPIKRAPQTRPAIPLRARALPASPAYAPPRLGAPVMPVREAVHGAFTGDLFQAPARDRLPVQTPALSGLDTLAALPTDVHGAPSLTDTQSKLAGLFGQFPIG